MSITRIIGGEMKNTTTGIMDLHASEGDYNILATTQNNWHGEEDGIIHKEYEPLDPVETISNTLELTLNIFFDGTTNNKTNTEAREKNDSAYQKNSNKKDDSYENDFTNVARAYDAVSIKDPKHKSIYVEGVGTNDLDSDDTLPIGIAQSAGFWHSGLRDKVKIGCEKGALEVKKASDGKPIDLLTINVYGFSRGAATARHFLHLTNESYTASILSNGSFYLPGRNNPLTHPKNEKNAKAPYPKQIVVKHGYFGQCLIANGMYEVKKIAFNFVGLYDTVSSHGFYHGNDVSDLGLDAIKKARMVFQLSAADEYRENFDLTDIRSAGLHGLELILPGVHSDIGGSYLHNDNERSAVYGETYTETYNKNRETTPYTKKADAFKKILVEEGWYAPSELNVEFKYDETKTYLVGTRTLQNTYDKVPLNKMIMVSKQFDVKYDETLEKQKTNISDPFIADVFTQLTQYSKAVMEHRNNSIKENKDIQQYIAESAKISYLDYIKSEDLKRLRHEYLHWSVKADKFGLGPRFDEVLPIEKRKREIHHG
ncbi:DUF2235 domain-containing protein [Flavobacterium sp. Fl-77]|uniref:DUF2235 domain-containing protein n=1 Tax=Flavobacterium flavipigmentatum TaxID=2893884 RepID=A0AAJ2SKM2_9FLAO|nr:MULTISPECIES: DUF2235 domain-containing protein [unclassified Flavobacterium]MDX6184094.1 DUF2235 domain-containing protein [Flavobacterium sp. Fl-33]MDX6187688.1 DUF2235 domain-containing protein [Flavobacterium sp. Fl-77]UFH39206.1 DUF2235 domain-containing protein [Flavobacterium sp. F-70]